MQTVYQSLTEIQKHVRKVTKLKFPIKTCGCGNEFATKAETCKACIKRKRLDAAKQWRVDNPEKYRAKYLKRLGSPQQKAESKAYYLAHREERRTARKKRYAADPKKIIAQNKRYYEANSEKMIVVKAAWMKAHRPKMNEYARRRHAKKINATMGDPEEIRKFYEMVYAAESIRCYWCNKFAPKGQRNIDHIHPLNKHGAHAVLNLCCACETCNKSKRDKLPESFNNGQLEMFTVTTPA